jgi:hypothetical protein
MATPLGTYNCDVFLFAQYLFHASLHNQSSRVLSAASMAAPSGARAESGPGATASPAPLAARVPVAGMCVELQPYWALCPLCPPPHTHSLSPHHVRSCVCTYCVCTVCVHTLCALCVCVILCVRARVCVSASCVSWADECAYVCPGCVCPWLPAATKCPLAAVTLAGWPCTETVTVWTTRASWGPAFGCWLDSFGAPAAVCVLERVLIVCVYVCVCVCVNVCV